MLRTTAAVCVALSLSACNGVAVKTFADATQNVNEGFAFGKQLRDRCAATNDLDHCKAWMDYKRAEEADNPLMDYDKALARWEANGPY